MMKLKDFVAETLKQIIDGVADAQEYASRRQKHSVVAPRRGIGQQEVVKLCTQNVEFDVAVTESEGGEAKAGIGVFFSAVAAGGQTQYESSSSTANRIRFSVPVLFPYPPQEE